MYIDYAEFQASRGRPMYMKNWEEKLNAFLKFNEQDILAGKGKVSHDVAAALADKEYQVFRVKQDRDFENDFDKLTKRVKMLKKPVKRGRKS